MDKAKIMENWPTFTDGAPITPGTTMPTIRGDMLEVTSVAIGKNGYTIWGRRDGVPYIINEGGFDMLEQPRTLEEAADAPFEWFELVEVDA